MTFFDEQGRPEPHPASGEADMLLGFLEFLRATFRWKCEGLDAAGMRATLAPSTMTLAGLMKHLSWVEDYWFSRRLFGNEPAEPWRSVDWEADRDWEWHSALDDTPEQLFALWEASMERSRRFAADALAHGDLGRPAAVPWPDGNTPSLRWILVHMVEEYGRHVGHADLLRESVDGMVGE